MAYDDIVLGAVANEKILEVGLRDSTTGQLKSNITFGSVTYSYIREGDDANKVVDTCVEGTIDTYVDHGWKATTIPGIYQFGVPNAALAAGKNAVTIKLSAEGVIDAKIRILIMGSDLRAEALGQAGAQAAIDATALGDLLDLFDLLTEERAGYLDWLNVGGLVASQADIQGITQAQRVRVLPAPQMERPDEGSVAYRVWIYVYDEQHRAEDLDENPTVTAENNAGADRSANLGTVTKPNGTTGIYYVDYGVAVGHAVEGMVFKVAATEGAVTTHYAAPSVVVDTTAVDFTAADRTKLDAIHGKLPSRDYLAGSEAETGETQTDAAAAIAAAGIPAATKSAVEADGSKLDHLWETTEDDAGVRRFTENALEEAPTGGSSAPTVEEIDAQLTEQHGAGSWQQSVGTGEGAHTVLVTVTDGTDPVEDVRVRFTKGVDSYVGLSDAAGEVTFNLDAGTYTVAATRPGYAYAGDTVEIAASAEVEIEMAPVSVGPPAEPSQTRAYGTTRTPQGVAEPDVDLEFALVTPTTEGIHGRAIIKATSDDDGQVTVDLLRSATYKVRRIDRGVWREFTTADAETYQLPAM